MYKLLLPDEVRHKAREAAKEYGRFLVVREIQQVDAAARVAYAAGRADERERVVAWLLGCAGRMRVIMPRNPSAGSPFELAADTIKQGRHLVN